MMVIWNKQNSRLWRRRLAASALGLLVGVALLAAAAIGAAFFTSDEAAEPAFHENWSGDVLMLPDPDLGYRFRHLATARHRMVQGDKTLVDVTYSLDENGRRITPGVTDTATRFLLFLGDSFTFGLGVAGDQTLPARVAAQAPGYRAYNYGVCGYGPAHVLLLLKKEGLRAQVPERRGLAIYTFIDDHVNRLIGRVMEPISPMHWLLPYYVLTPGGGIEHRGNLETGRPAYINALYRWFGSSIWRRCFNLSWPLRITRKHLALTLGVFVEMQRMLNEDFNQSPLVVVFFPGSRLGRKLSDPMTRAGIICLDYSTIFKNQAESFPTLPNRHPAAAMYAAIAKYLADDLRELGLIVTPTSSAVAPANLH